MLFIHEFDRFNRIKKNFDKVYNSIGDNISKHLLSNKYCVKSD